MVKIDNIYIGHKNMLKLLIIDVSEQFEMLSLMHDRWASDAVTAKLHNSKQIITIEAPALYEVSKLLCSFSELP